MKTLAIAILFAAGILTAYLFSIPVFLLYIAAAVFLTAAVLFLRNSASDIFIYILIFLSGILIYQNSQAKGPSHITNLTQKGYQDVIAKGIIVRNPATKKTMFGTKTTFVLRPDHILFGNKIIDVRGDILVDIIENKNDYEYGDTVVMEGSLYKPSLPRNPGGFDYNAFLRSNSIYAILKVNKFNSAVVISKKKPLLSLRHIFSVKNKFRNIFYERFLDYESGLLNAIILGERDNLDATMRDAFVKTGTMHLLAISGLHVAIVLVIILFIFRIFFVPKNIANILAIFALIFYCIMTGGAPSVLRATIMASIFLMAWVMMKDYSAINTLAVSFIAVLLFNPMWLFDAGFQLSFASVLAMILLTGKVDALLRLDRIKRNHTYGRVIFYFGKLLSVSISVFVVVFPIIAYYFNIVSVASIFINLIAIPASFLIIAMGFGFVFLEGLPFVGDISAQLAQHSTAAFINLVSGASKFREGWFFIRTPTAFEIAAYYILILFVINAGRFKVSAKKVLIVLLVAANIFIWKGDLFAGKTDLLKVTFLDVGDGDAIFIQFPDNKNMLIDSGEGVTKDMGRMVLRPFLLKNNIRNIDAILLTHPDSDHIGGFINILKDFKVRYAFDSGRFYDSYICQLYKKLIEEKHIKRTVLKSGLSIIGFDDARLYVLNPQDTPIKGSKTDVNNNSVVLKLAYKDMSMLFTGDIEQEGILQLLSYGQFLKSEVLKVPHHGKNKTLELELLFALAKPEIAVISDEQYHRKKYGPETWYDSFDAAIYRTSRFGAVSITTNGKKIDVETMVK